MIPELNHWIDGHPVKGRNGTFGDVYDPAKGEVKSKVPMANSVEVGEAVAAAEKAFPAWRSTPPLKRARILFRFLQLLHDYEEELVGLIVSEHGKVKGDAQGSLARGMEVVEFACGIPHLLKGEFSDNVGAGIDCWSMRQPLGVCAGISPFNFPAMVPMWMFPLAIACGNTFVMKPSEKVPSCMLRLAELTREAGLPNGVLNVINGAKESVEALLSDPRVQAVSCVGSTPTAKSVYTIGCANGKRVQALAGAKNHLIVMPDADLDQAANALMGAAYGSAGERCMAVAVAVAVEGIGDALIDRLVPKIKHLKIGPGTDPASEMGPLITREHLSRVLNYVETGQREGAHLLVDGRELKPKGFEKGHFLGGCLFDHVTPTMKIYREEIFGPVLCVVRTPDLAKALQMVNENPFGNGTSIFTRNGDAARTFSHNIQAGMVGINIPIPVPMAFHSFGGWKQSLFGDCHIHGMEGVRFYTKLKTVSCRWPDDIHSSAEYSMPTLQ